MHTGRLVLGPQDPFLAPDPATLEGALRAAGLLAAPLPGGSGAFAAGGGFLELLIFAGCSVQVELSPTGDGTPFTHVRIAGPEPVPRFVRGRNTRPPRCRACRAPLRDWQDALSGQAEPGGDAIGCPACGASAPAWAWDWKETAGFGRVLVLIEEVFPGEAVPAPALLDTLARASGGPWRHFYVQDA